MAAKKTNNRTHKTISMLKNRKTQTGTTVLLTLLSIVAGLTGFAFITLVNEVISVLITAPETLDKTHYFWLFSTLVGMFFISRRLLSGGIIKMSQAIYWNTRLDVVKFIIRAPYQRLKEQRNEIYSTLTHDVGNITQASLLIIEFATSIVLIVTSLGYMAYLSLPLFWVSIGVIALGVVVYELLSRQSTEQFNKARDLEEGFISSFNAIMNGAKEINMDRSKGYGIYDKKTASVANEALRNNQKAYVGFLNSQLVGQILFYILITFILLYGGSTLNVSVLVTINFTFVLLYILGPIGNVMSIIPFASRAMISMKRMRELKEKMISIADEKSHTELKRTIEFEKLEYSSCSFSYGENKFGIGPIDFTLKKGEINFIYGGNGSGKTTFMNTLLSIYVPTEGKVQVNGKEVKNGEIQLFKSLFAVVFGDYHLFDQFYGNTDFDRERAKRYLKLFEIEEKVSITDTGFSTIDLSTGQRKRLTLIAALLEEKPILVLDEWAADQDPYFRKKFYQEIIPQIKKEGITVLAITHDDKYYHIADRLFKMEYGQLKEEGVEPLLKHKMSLYE